MVKQLAFVRRIVGPEQNLLDVGVLFLRAVNGHALWLTHNTGSQLLDARREGCAEHHGLFATDSELVQLGQIIGEAQIQHAIGFIDHQKLHLVQLDLHGALQIQQTAWGCYHQIGILQLGNLQLVGHAAHHIGNTQTTAMAN